MVIIFLNPFLLVDGLQAPADINKLPLSFGTDIREKFIEAR